MAAIAATFLLGTVGACGSSEEEPGGSRTILQPTTGPYVSVAVNDHFHDVHPEDDVQLAGDRSLVIKNQGSNLHNVTLVEAHIDVDLKTGEEYSIGPPLTDLLEVGKTYIFFCKYHPEAQMLGQFTVTAP
ncbi:MAG: hypothetical protein JJE05_00590 [Actinobacteria bacterium]|nr:hypothetical protein [Actinomycetota bacterium]